MIEDDPERRPFERGANSPRSFDAAGRRVRPVSKRNERDVVALRLDAVIVGFKPIDLIPNVPCLIE